MTTPQQRPERGEELEPHGQFIELKSCALFAIKTKNSREGLQVKMSVVTVTLETVTDVFRKEEGRKIVKVRSPSSR